jgi:glycerophosphoryl diester phosphodiesterase
MARRWLRVVVFGLLATDTSAFLAPMPGHHAIMRRSMPSDRSGIAGGGRCQRREEAGTQLISMQVKTAEDSVSTSHRQLPQVIGHRGARAVAPENTLASIRAAKSLGCSWVEVDVMLTKDKVPVIHHDNTLNRCTNGEGNLWDYTVAELGQLDAGSHYDEASGFPATLYPGERIPTLTGLLQCCRDLELGLNLEVKHVTERAPQAPSPREQKMEEVNINI